MMARYYVLLFCIAFLMTGSAIFAQSPAYISRSVYQGCFHPAERFVKRQVREVKKGVLFDNGPGSGMLVSHEAGLDTIVERLKRLPCVEDAYRDRCQAKIMIWPGWSVIGVKFTTKDGTLEKCFHIQEGTTGSLYIFGWRPHITRMRDILVYKKMFDCPGFIEEQRKLCKEL